MTEDKWWLKSGFLNDEEREQITDEQRAERRLHLFRRRADEAGRQFTAARKKRMARWLKQWFHAEVLTHLNGEQPYHALQEWVRQQFKEVILAAWKGRENAIKGMIQQVVREEVGHILREVNPAYRDGFDQRGRSRDAMQGYLRGLVEEEVRKTVAEALDFDIKVTGRVHKPAIRRMVDFDAYEHGKGEK